MKFLEDLKNIKVELTRNDSIFCSGLEPKYVRDKDDNQFEVIDAKEPLKPILSTINKDYKPRMNETGQWYSFGGYCDLVRRNR